MQVFKRGLGSASKLASTRCCGAASRAPLVPWTRVRSIQTQQVIGSRQPPVSKSPPAVYSSDWQPPTIDVELRTLRREELSPDDFVDLSDSRGVAYDPSLDASESLQVPYLTYGRRQSYSKQLEVRFLNYTPFPVNTRGFFYYRAHPSVPEGGSLRFRVTHTRDPRLFDAGQDLLTEFGTPWQIPLIAIAVQPRLGLVRALLEREKLVTPALLEKCAALAKSAAPNSIGAMSQIVYQAGEPFHLNLTDPSQTVYVAGEGLLYRLTPRKIFVTWHEKGCYDWKYIGGVLRCALHIVVFGPKRSAICLRVQREIEPVRERADAVEGMIYVREPMPGKLLQTQNHALWDLFLAPVPGPRLMKRSLLQRGEQGRYGRQGPKQPRQTSDGIASEGVHQARTRLQPSVSQ